MRLATVGGGGGFVAPMFDMDGGGFYRPFPLTITATAPANQLQYAATGYGGALPGTVTTVNATSVTFTVNSTKRVWARCGDGTSWSAWVFQDYQKYAGPPYIP